MVSIAFFWENLKWDWYYCGVVDGIWISFVILLWIMVLKKFIWTLILLRAVTIISSNVPKILICYKLPMSLWSSCLTWIEYTYIHLYKSFHYFTNFNHLSSFKHSTRLELCLTATLCGTPYVICSSKTDNSWDSPLGTIHIAYSHNLLVILSLTLRSDSALVQLSWFYRYDL